MAAKRWYLTTTPSNGGVLSETAQSAGTFAAGWVVGTGTTNHSEFTGVTSGGTDRPSTTFTGTTVPDGTLDFVLDDYLVTDPINGNFASGNWTFQFAVISTVQAGAADGQIVFRIIKCDWNRANPVEITSAQQSASVCTNVGATDVNGTLTFNPGAISLVNQRLCIQLAWKRTGAGGMTTTNIRLRAGVSASVGTTILSSDFTQVDPPARAVTTPHIASTALFPYGATEDSTPWASVDAGITHIASFGNLFSGMQTPAQFYQGLTGWLSSVELLMAKVGNPTSSVSITIQQAQIDGTIGTSVLVAGTAIASGFHWEKFTFTTPVRISGIWFKLHPTTTTPVSASDYYQWGLSNNINLYVNGHWGNFGNPDEYDANFKLYTRSGVGGPTVINLLQVVTMPAMGSTATVGAPTIATVQAVTADTVASGSAVYAPAVAGAGVSAQEVGGAFIGGEYYVLLEDESGPVPLEDEPFGVLLEGYAGGVSEVFAPTVAIDTATYVTGATIASTSTLTSPTVTTGAVEVFAATLVATALLFAPTLLPQAVTISGPTRPTTIQVFAPTVAPGAVTITTAHRATTIQVFAPTVVPQAVTVIGATIGRIYPSVTTRLGAQQTLSTTAHPITLPAHVAGDLLLVIWSVRTGTANTNTLSGSGGWTTVHEYKYGISATQFVLYKIATSSSESLTITTSGNQRSSHVVYRITGAAQVTGTAIGVTSTPNFDPPSHTPGGVQDYLWLTALSQQLINSAIIPPANYLNAVSIIPTLTSMTTGAAEREVSATSEDPGAWTNASTTGVIGTIAVWPGVPVSQAQPPIITPGAVTVGGAHRAATSQLFSPTIAVGPATVLGAHIGSTVVLYVPALTQLSAGAIGAAHIPTSAVVHAPSVVGGLATITVPFIASTSLVRIPSVAVGPATVLAATRASTALLFPPSVVPLAIGITAGTRPTTIQVFAPTVTRGAVTVGGATISTASAVHAPTVIRTGMVTGQTVASSLVLFSPSVTTGVVSITGGTVAAISQVFAPIVGVGVTAIGGATITATSETFAPTIIRRLDGAFIGSADVLYPPSVEIPGVTTGPLPSGTLLFPPSLVVEPAPPGVAPCMESTVAVRYLASSFAIDCKILAVGRVEVETLTMSTIQPQAPAVTATIRVRTLVSSEGLRTCCLEVQP